MTNTKKTLSRKSYVPYDTAGIQNLDDVIWKCLHCGKINEDRHMHKREIRFCPSCESDDIYVHKMKSSPKQASKKKKVK